MGAATTQWLAYAHAVQSSPNKERFGKGDVRGVLGPGAANNSTLGGSLITTIAFGVPASVVMAILLGAFIIQGIVPGPDMLLPPPKGKLDLTFSFVWVIIISNIITVAVCFLFLKPLAKVTQVRGGIIIPLILVLIYLGAFAEKNAFEDMIIVLFFGALGWIMEKMDWPRPPVLLGLVLGPLAENRLFLSTDNYGLAWTSRPGVIAIFVLTLAGIFYPMYKSRREARKKAAADTSTQAGRRSYQSRALHFRRGDAVYAYGDRGALGRTLAEPQLRIPRRTVSMGHRHSHFDFGLLASSAGISTARKRPKRPGSHAELDTRRGRAATISDPSVDRRLFVAIWLLGFPYAVPLVILLYLKFAGRESWLITAIVTFFAWLFFWGLFREAAERAVPGRVTDRPDQRRRVTSRRSRLNRQLLR